MQKEKKTQNYYFTKQVELDIVDYCKTTDRKIKNQLYISSIGKTLKELIDNIVQVYKLGALPNISFLKEECLLYLITILNKYDPDKISKRTGKTSAAYTYFTVVTKHWFFFQYKKYKKQKYEETNIDDVHDIEQTDNITEPHEYESFRDRNEFKFFLLEEMNWWKHDFPGNDNVNRVVEALINLFERSNELDFLDKRGIYVYLRELSGLETKDISPIIKKIVPALREFMSDWRNSEI